jgi:hypothetical protein
VAAGSIAVNGSVEDAQVGDYIKFAVDTLESGAKLIKSITEVVRSWNEYYKEKAEAEEAEEARRAVEAEAEAAAAREREAERRRELEDAGVTGDPAVIDTLDILLGPEREASLELAAEFFKEKMETSSASQLIKSLNDPESDQFNADMPRMQNILTVGGEFVNTDGIDPNSSDRQNLIAGRGRDMLAQCLTGDKNVKFDDLGQDQQRQVYLLAGLCHQGSELAALHSTNIELFGESQLRHGQPAGATAPVDANREMAISNDGDNIVVHIKSTTALNAITYESGRVVFLDSDRSEQILDNTVVVSRSEFARMSQLDWNQYDAANRPSDSEYRMRFVENTLNSSIALYAPPGR